MGAYEASRLATVHQPDLKRGGVEHLFSPAAALLPRSATAGLATSEKKKKKKKLKQEVKGPHPADHRLISAQVDTEVMRKWKEAALCEQML